MRASTVVRSQDLLKDACPACPTDQALAALTMHTVLTVHRAEPRSIGHPADPTPRT